MSIRLMRWTGIGGVLFFLALAAAVLATPGSPDTNASAAKVVKFYHDHKDAVQVNAYVTELAVVIGIVFFWYLREYVSTIAENRRLATLGFAGGLFFAASGGLAAGVNQAAADGAKHLQPGSLQLLNVLSDDLTNFLGGIGVAVLLVATGITLIRSNVLPRWLGWIGVVIGVASLVLAFIGLAGAGLWSLITGIVLIVRANHQPSTAAKPAGPATASATPTSP